MNNAPILIVNEDPDDWELLKEAWKELDFENPLIFYDNGEDVLQYLKKEEEPPFLILCDVNLSKMDGFELKEKILQQDEVKYKGIPFVFWSLIASNRQIKKSYDLGGNGFFLKGNSFEEIKDSLNEIVKYWQKSRVPE